MVGSAKFEVAEILKRGWWSTKVRIVAAEPMRHEEKRMRYSHMRVARIEMWCIDVQAGENFDLSRPSPFR